MLDFLQVSVADFKTVETDRSGKEVKWLRKKYGVFMVLIDEKEEFQY